MNRNYPKVKNSPKWSPKPDQPSINNQINFMKPNYSSRAGKMVKVLYGCDFSHYCLTRNNYVTLLCTYFVTNKRDRRFPNRYKPNENDTSNDDFHLDKRKLCTTTIKNETTKTQSYERNSKKINAVLEGLGFVCNDDNIYTDCASQIHCYNAKKQYYTGYDTKTYTSPKSKNPILQNSQKPSESYKQKENSEKSVLHSNTFQQTNYYHKNYNPILQNSQKPSESYKQKENSEKSVLHSNTFQQTNYYHKNYNPILQNYQKPSESYKQKENSEKSVLHSNTFQQTNYYHKNYNPILQNYQKPSESYKQKENSEKSVLHSNTFQQTNYYHKNYNPILQNYQKPSESYKQKENSEKSVLHSNTFQQTNYYHNNYNRHQNVITQNNTSSNQMNHTAKKTHHFFQNEQIPIKYWAMRHMLFSKFDSGIQLDLESFYSVCPEVLSHHIAKRCENNIVCDPFCGAGGNIIQLAMICKKVIAVDIDPNKIRMARHNAEIYGVAEKIEFIVGDIFLIYPKLKADVVFMSPPWGGPGYSLSTCYSLKTMCNDHVGGGFGIFDVVKTIAPNIAFHMPKNTNILECVLLAKDFGKVEIQQNIINGKLNSLTAFFGHFYWNSN